MGPLKRQGKTLAEDGKFVTTQIGRIPQRTIVHLIDVLTQSLAKVLLRSFTIYDCQIMSLFSRRTNAIKEEKL